MPRYITIKLKIPRKFSIFGQTDRDIYKSEMQQAIANTANLSVVEASVEDVVLGDNDSVVQGIKTAGGKYPDTFLIEYCVIYCCK